MNAAMYRVSWISLYIAGALCPEHSGSGNNHPRSDLDFRLGVKFVFQLDNNPKRAAKNKKKVYLKPLCECSSVAPLEPRLEPY